MTPEGWRKAFEVFHVAVVHDAGTRAAYLDDACRGDAAIRRAVEQLVAAHEAAGDFLEQPAVIRVQHTELPPPADDQAAADAAPPDFSGTERFALVRVLGRGGMGIVYEAHDRRRNEIVALKTLHRVNPTDIYHLKHEFRGLADVAHPNLASLYELVVEGPHCFFTMEIVNGVSLIQHVREGIDGRGRAAGRAHHACIRPAGRGTRGTARVWQAPSRYQAVERPGHTRRARRHSRFRADCRRPARTRRDQGTRGGHAGLHGARGYRRRESDRGQRLVQRRHHPLSGADRPRAVRGSLRRAAPAENHHRSPAARRDCGERPRPAERDLPRPDLARAGAPPGRPRRPSGVGLAIAGPGAGRHGRCAGGDQDTLCRPRASARRSARPVRTGLSRQADFGLHPRRVGHRQEHARAALPRSAPHGGRCRDSARALLRAGNHPLQGARRRHRQPERLSPIAAGARGRAPAAARRAGAGARVSGHAAGRFGQRRFTAVARQRRSARFCGVAPSGRSTNC